MTSPLDRERKTLNALCFLRRQAKAFLLAVDDGLPAATLAGPLRESTPGSAA